MIKIRYTINKNINKIKKKRSKNYDKIWITTSGGGRSELTEGWNASFSVIPNLFQDLNNGSSDVRKAGGQAVFCNVIAHLLRNQKFVCNRSRTKSAMTEQLSVIPNLFRDLISGRLEGKKVRGYAVIKRQYIRKSSV